MKQNIPSGERVQTRIMTLLKQRSGLIAICCSLIINSAHAQCMSGAYTNGTVFATQSAGTSSDFDFSIPVNAQASDNVRSSASASVTVLNGNTYYLKATGFGFALPSYATICGVNVHIERRAQGLGLGSVQDNEVKLIRAGVIGGTNNAIGTAWTGSDLTMTYSGPWGGAALTVADVNSPNFGVAISVNVAGIAVAPSVQIDNISVSIVFNLVLPVKLEFFTASHLNNDINLKWKTTGEEDQGLIELQQSLNNGDWKTISHYETFSINNGKIYSYQDHITAKGEYAYRIKMTTPAGAVTFSEIKSVHSDARNVLTVFPNPANDYVIIDNVTHPETVQVRNLYQQQLKMAIQNSSSGSYRIDIRSLPAGIYFVSADGETKRFVKE